MAETELNRLVIELTHEVKQVRWYLGLLCLMAGIGLLLFGLVAFGVLTVDVKATR